MVCMPLKGFKGFSPEDAYNAIKASLTVSHKKSDWETYDKYGYYPDEEYSTSYAELMSKNPPFHR